MKRIVMVLIVLILLTGCDLLTGKKHNFEELQELNMSYSVALENIRDTMNCQVVNDTATCYGDDSAEQVQEFDLANLRTENIDAIIQAFPYLEVDFDDLEKVSDTRYEITGDNMVDFLMSFSSDEYTLEEIQDEVDSFGFYYYFIIEDGKLTAYGLCEEDACSFDATVDYSSLGKE